ncbi:hypothetical protein SK128_009093, partial [Halocaridina rubra]
MKCKSTSLNELVNAINDDDDNDNLPAVVSIPNLPIQESSTLTTQLSWSSRKLLIYVWVCLVCAVFLCVIFFRGLTRLQSNMMPGEVNAKLISRKPGDLSDLVKYIMSVYEVFVLQ